MTKKLALLLMVATLFFVETILKDGGDLDRIAGAAPGSVAPSSEEDPFANQPGGLAPSGLMPDQSDQMRSNRLANPWDAPNERGASVDDHYVPASARRSEKRRSHNLPSGSTPGGALSPHQMNLEQ